MENRRLEHSTRFRYLLLKIKGKEISRKEGRERRENYKKRKNMEGEEGERKGKTHDERQRCNNDL